MIWILVWTNRLAHKCLVNLVAWNAMFGLWVISKATKQLDRQEERLKGKATL
jgi:hypothetical protein